MFIAFKIYFHTQKITKTAYHARGAACVTFKMFNNFLNIYFKNKLSLLQYGRKGQRTDCGSNPDRVIPALRRQA